MQPFFKGFGTAIAWAIIIFALCTIHLGSVTSNPLFFAGFDKLVHCGMFFVLVVLLGYGLLVQSRLNGNMIRPLVLSTFLTIGYGGIIELLQHYLFTWRSGEWADLFADAVGAFMGLFSFLVIFKALNYVKK